MPLQPNALTTVAQVQARRNMSGISATEAERLIAVMSEAIEQECQRRFSYATVTERLPSLGSQVILLERTPLVSITSITLDGALLDASEYEVDDDAAGKVYRERGWPWLAQTIDTAGGPARLPGTERKVISAVYSGGYVPQGTAWSGAATFLGGSFVRPSTSTTGNVFQAAATGTTHATVEPTWAAVAIGATVTDGSITWKNVGPRTLPYDLEQACLDGVVSLYDEDGRNKNVTGEAVGDASVQYSGRNPAIGREGSIIPDSALVVLAKYRRA